MYYSLPLFHNKIRQLDCNSPDVAPKKLDFLLLWFLLQNMNKVMSGDETAAYQIARSIIPAHCSVSVFAACRLKAALSSSVPTYLLRPAERPETRPHGLAVVQDRRRSAAQRGLLPAAVQRQGGVQRGGDAAVVPAAAVQRRGEVQAYGQRSGHFGLLLGEDEHGHLARRGQGVALHLLVRLPVQGRRPVPKRAAGRRDPAGREDLRHGLAHGRRHHGRYSAGVGSDSAG